MTIFIQIASYRDPELVPTIRDCIKKAKYPDQLTFGICWQRDETESLEEFANVANIKVIEIPWEESKGACWARSQVQKLWNGEDYTLQLDSHHRFAENWDETLIEMLKSTNSPKPLIGSYAGSYSPKTESRNADPYIMVADRFTETGNLLFKPHTLPNWQNLQAPVKARFVSGHFYFTLGIHCKEVLYDPELYFTGEEETLSIRSYTHGYDLFHPHKLIIWHEYTREGRTKHWVDHQKWWEIDNLSKKRVRHLLKEEDNGTDLTIYGLGSVRSHHDYEIYAGIDFKNRRMQQITFDGIEPPSIYKDESSWEAGFAKSHTVNVKWSIADIEPCDDYDFWFFSIENGAFEMIYRGDITDPNIFARTECTKTATFLSSNRPFRSIIWPHSATKGWLKKLEIIL